MGSGNPGRPPAWRASFVPPPKRLRPTAKQGAATGAAWTAARRSAHSPPSGDKLARLDNSFHFYAQVPRTRRIACPPRVSSSRRPPCAPSCISTTESTASHGRRRTTRRQPRNRPDSHSRGPESQSQSACPAHFRVRHAKIQRFEANPAGRSLSHRKIQRFEANPPAAGYKIQRFEANDATPKAKRAGALAPALFHCGLRVPIRRP